MNTVELLMKISEATVMASYNNDTEVANFLSKIGADLYEKHCEECNRQQQAKQACITTFTGKHLYAFNPKPEQICLRDIAHALSKNNRFTGHSAYNYTVGLHSIHVYNVLLSLGEDETTCLMGLLHDASEAYLQDIAKPFKIFLPDYQEVEELLQNAIFEKYIGFVPTPEQYSIVKMVDEILLVNEIEQLMGEEYYKSNVARIHVDLTQIYPQDLVRETFINIAKELGAND